MLKGTGKEKETHTQTHHSLLHSSPCLLPSSLQGKCWASDRNVETGRQVQSLNDQIRGSHSALQIKGSASSEAAPQTVEGME